MFSAPGTFGYAAEQITKPGGCDQQRQHDHQHTNNFASVFIV